jgi:predicted nuclease of predicted toxin-antitoxin system
MKLLLDENLSPVLAARLSDCFPGSMHVEQCGLASVDDAQIWAFAAQHEFTIVTKDSDFHELSVLRGQPPKVVWLRFGNCTTTEIEASIRRFALAIADFIQHPSDNFLILTRQSFMQRRTL